MDSNTRQDEIWARLAAAEHEVVARARTVLADYDAAEVHWCSSGIAAMEAQGPELVRGLLKQLHSLRAQLLEQEVWHTQNRSALLEAHIAELERFKALAEQGEAQLEQLRARNEALERLREAAKVALHKSREFGVYSVQATKAVLRLTDELHALSSEDAHAE